MKISIEFLIFEFYFLLRLRYIRTINLRFKLWKFELGFYFTNSDPHGYFNLRRGWNAVFYYYYHFEEGLDGRAWWAQFLKWSYSNPFQKTYEAKINEEYAYFCIEGIDELSTPE